jgi:hypothetical protein
MSDRSSCDRMVEVLVFVVPLDTCVMIAIVFKSLVDRSQILETTHRSNKLMGNIEHWSIILADT